MASETERWQAQQKKGKEPPPDPTEWRPRDNSGWEQVQDNVTARQVGDKVQYPTLAQKSPQEIAAIEMTAMANLRQAMNRSRLALDERSLRGHWEFHVEGYGFPMPEGYVHPEAPAHVHRAGREVWGRAVEGASDSVLKMIFAMAWRRRRPQIEAESPLEVTSGDE